MNDADENVEKWSGAFAITITIFLVMSGRSVAVAGRFDAG